VELIVSIYTLTCMTIVIKPESRMPEASLRLVNVWVDSEPGPGGFNPMASSMLWLPENQQPGHPAPAFIYVHGWGGYPYDELPSSLGPTLAEQGFALLSVCLRRRGMEGQLLATPDNDLRDIKLAVDYLHTNGYEKLILVGEEIGCISVLNYLSQHGDRRVAGAALIDPVDTPADWLRAVVGEDLYNEQLALAGTAARQGAGMDVRIDFLPEGGPQVTQNAGAFLGWWGPAAKLSPGDMLGAVNVPVAAFTEASASLPNGLADAELFEVANVPAVAKSLQEFAAACGCAVTPEPPLEMVRIESAGQSLFALHWTPADGQPVKTVTLLMPGLTSSPLSPLFLKMAPVLAQTGTAVLAVEVRRSGWAGHESALLEYDAEDIDVWIKFLLDRGYEKIVLAGASIGSISVGRYQSVHQHPAVVGIAHLMPTADCSKWFRLGAGDGPYAEAVAQAQAAVAEGRGATELVDIDIRQPPPNKYAGRFRWTQRAASWLSWWGPDADSTNSVHIANANVPLLLLSGTEDSYNDAARFAELKAAAVNAPSVDEIWYPGIDHGLAGVEMQVAQDLFAWIKKIGAV
jgi:pimeloyl-ACP methyl ester carboxylesterase